MRSRSIVFALGAAIVGAALAARRRGGGARPRRLRRPRRSGPAEKALEAYLLKYLPWDPELKLTIARTNEKSVPGFRAYKAHRTGRYKKLNGDKVVLVSEDGKWFFAGDTLPNKDPKPVRSSDDLAWLSAYLTNLFRTPAVATLAPEQRPGEG